MVRCLDIFPLLRPTLIASVRDWKWILSHELTLIAFDCQGLHLGSSWRNTIIDQCCPPWMGKGSTYGIVVPSCILANDYIQCFILGVVFSPPT